MIASILSVRQPWAWLICAGFKDVENRTWATKHRGELFVHAGRSFDWSFFWWVDERKGSPAVVGAAHMVVRHFGIRFGDTTKDSRITRHQEEFGAIIGKAMLHDIITSSTSVWADSEANHWIMKRPLVIEPIPMKGSLGVFLAEIPNEVKIIGNADRCLR